MKTRRVGLARGGARLATRAERDATARKIVAKTSAWAKKTLKGV